MENNVDLKQNETLGDKLTLKTYFLPLVDIYDQNDAFILTANLPGVPKENVKLSLENGTLAILGKAKEDNEVGKKYVINEIPYGNFYREFKLTDTIDTSKITAKFENGRLSITLPKQEKAKPRTIEVN
jgi:HSP20 family protein